MRREFVEAVITEKVISVHSGSEYRGVKLRPGSGRVELERHAEVNRGCGLDAAPGMAVTGLAGECRNNIWGIKMELAKPDVGRDAQHGAENLDVQSVFSAEPATIEDIAPSERGDGVKEVEFRRNDGSKGVSNVQNASESPNEKDLSYPTSGGRARVFVTSTTIFIR